MNRKRKINDILKKKIKKMNAKMHHNSKPKYVSKAERAKLELEQQNQSATAEQSDSESTKVSAS